MTIGASTNWQVCPVDASFGDYAAHNTSEEDKWREEYKNASEAAKEAAFYQAAQAVIIAGLQVAAANYAADKQYDIANRQMSIAEAEYQRYKDHFICVEHKLADDACVDVLYTPDYVTRAGRAVVDIRRQFDGARKRLARQRSRYCMSDFCNDMRDIEVEEAKMTAVAKDAAYRYEELERDKFDDRRFNRRMQVSNIGRGIYNSQSNTYNAGMEVANQSIMTRLAGWNNFLGALSGGISGMIQANYQSRLAPSQAIQPSVSNGQPYGYGSTGSTFNYNNAHTGPTGSF